MLIREELKDFSLNMIFLANSVLSFHKTHYVCDFCFFSSRKRRNHICLSLSLYLYGNIAKSRNLRKEIEI